MSKYTRIYITSELGSPGSLTITELSSPGSPTFADDDEPRGEPLVRISTAVHEPLTVAAAKAVRVLQDRADAARTGLQAMGLYEPPAHADLGTDLRDEIAKIVKPEEDETLTDAVARWGDDCYQAAEQKADSVITQLRAEISEARTVLEASPGERLADAVKRWGIDQREPISSSAVTALRAEISEARTVLEARPGETAPEAARRWTIAIREAVGAAPPEATLNACRRGAAAVRAEHNLRRQIDILAEILGAGPGLDVISAARKAVRDAYARKPCPAASEECEIRNTCTNKCGYLTLPSAGPCPSGPCATAKAAPPPPKYKVGDRVTITAPLDNDTRRYQGAVVAVKAYSGYGHGEKHAGHLYTTETLDGSSTVLAWERELAACPPDQAEPAPKYKAGDRLTVTEWCPEAPDFRGKPVEVIAAPAHTKTPGQSYGYSVALLERLQLATILEEHLIASATDAVDAADDPDTEAW